MSVSEDDSEKKVSDFTNGIYLRPDSSSLESLAIKNGCVILGKDAGRGNQYITRFKINRQEQTEAAHEGVCFEEYLPCCVDGKNPHARKFCWNLVRSEAFVLTLHMSVLVLGVMKEAINLRTVDEDLHLVHSIVETVVACIVVAMRIAGTHHGSRKLKAVREDYEVVGAGSTINLRRRGLQRAVWTFTWFGVFLIVGDWAAFFMFKFIPGANLAWTILSNNAVLLFITISSNQVLGRIQKEIAKITEDHHKAVIYETILLLSESATSHTTRQSKEDTQLLLDKINRFCRALRDTELFKQPDYISCPSELQPHWDAVTTMQMVSFI